MFEREDGLEGAVQVHRQGSTVVLVVGVNDGPGFLMPMTASDADELGQALVQVGAQIAADLRAQEHVGQ